MQAGAIVKKTLWLFLAASIALAILRGFPLNPSEWYAWSEQQLVDVREWASGVGEEVNTFIDEAPTPTSIIPSPSEQPPDGPGGGEADSPAK